MQGLMKQIESDFDKVEPQTVGKLCRRTCQAHHFGESALAMFCLVSQNSVKTQTSCGSLVESGHNTATVVKSKELVGLPRSFLGGLQDPLA